MNLIDFVNKNVVIIDDNNKEWKGLVDSYCSAIDNNTKYDSIALEVTDKKNRLVEFMENEIKSIEII